MRDREVQDGAIALDLAPEGIAFLLESFEVAIHLEEAAHHFLEHGEVNCRQDRHQCTACSALTWRVVLVE